MKSANTGQVLIPYVDKEGEKEKTCTRPDGVEYYLYHDADANSDKDHMKDQPAEHIRINRTGVGGKSHFKAHVNWRRGNFDVPVAFNVTRIDRFTGEKVQYKGTLDCGNSKNTGKGVGKNGKETDLVSCSGSTDYYFEFDF